MLLGWIVVAFYEWAATRELPHYGRGLPPRYYVPQIALPPPRQLEQLRVRVSGGRAGRRGDLDRDARDARGGAGRLAARPRRGPLPAPNPGEDTMVVDNLLLVAAAEEYHEDTWIELDPVAEGRDPDEDAVAVGSSGRRSRGQRRRRKTRSPEWQPEPVAEVVVEEPVDAEPEPEIPSRGRAASSGGGAWSSDEPEAVEAVTAERRRRRCSTTSSRPRRRGRRRSGGGERARRSGAVQSRRPRPPRPEPDGGASTAQSPQRRWPAAVAAGRDAPAEPNEAPVEAEGDEGVEPVAAGAVNW